MARDFLAALTRRRLIGGVGAASLLPAARPSAAANAPAASSGPGELSPLKTEFVLEIRATLAPTLDMGAGANGVRRLVPITGGTFEGPKLRGVIEPGGGDWQLVRPDGVTSVEAKYTLRAGDGTLISVTNRGIIVPAASPSGASYVRTVPEFEVAIGPHDWLNRAVFVGSLDSTRFRQGSVVVRVFRVI